MAHLIRYMDTPTSVKVLQLYPRSCDDDYGRSDSCWVSSVGISFYVPLPIINSCHHFKIVVEHTKTLKFLYFYAQKSSDLNLKFMHSTYRYTTNTIFNNLLLSKENRCILESS